MLLRDMLCIYTEKTDKNRKTDNSKTENARKKNFDKIIYSIVKV